MVADGDYVVVFQSIHRVMKAEKLLKGKGLAVLLIPAPRSITSDCGLALRYGADIREAVEQALSEASLLPEDRYLKEGEFKKI
ncbi:DUF3343 domain-containing protein [Geobacter pelophilus]|uniref:DUF3343 domain-containing protein n=1 Tax=Geoanaerobacter pelophilus TaxID=60036 RepID=A0AAW4L8Y8_9BACT|nr:DUF3343 domain-containing protein [Geoanaerobacter pelophilus]